MDNTNMLPCPFTDCDGKVELEQAGTRMFWTICCDGGSCHHPLVLSDTSEAGVIAKWNRRPPAPGSVGARVKPLEWADYSSHAIANCEVGQYYIEMSLGQGETEYRVVMRRVFSDDKWFGHSTSLAETKAAAQADYATRILSALEPDTARDRALEEEAKHDPALVKEIQDAIVETAGRHPSLRGPWEFDEAELQAQATTIRALRSTPAPEDGWRDIKTAPKDGTWFQGWRPAAFVEEQHDVWHWDAEATTDNGRGFWINAADSNLDLFPTHWRPLPAAPNPPSQGGE